MSVGLEALIFEFTFINFNWTENNWLLGKSSIKRCLRKVPRIPRAQLVYFSLLLDSDLSYSLNDKKIVQGEGLFVTTSLKILSIFLGSCLCNWDCSDPFVSFGAEHYRTERNRDKTSPEQNMIRAKRKEKNMKFLKFLLKIDENFLSWPSFARETSIFLKCKYQKFHVLFLLFALIMFCPNYVLSRLRSAPELFVSIVKCCIFIWSRRKAFASLLKWNKN